MKMIVERQVISCTRPTVIFWLDSHIYYFELQGNAIFRCTNIPRHAETKLYSIKCNIMYLEPRILKGTPLYYKTCPYAAEWICVLLPQPALSQTGSSLVRTNLSPFARCTLGLTRHFDKNILCDHCLHDSGLYIQKILTK